MVLVKGVRDKRRKKRSSNTKTSENRVTEKRKEQERMEERKQNKSKKRKNKEWREDYDEGRKKSDERSWEKKRRTKKEGKKKKVSLDTGANAEQHYCITFYCILLRCITLLLTRQRLLYLVHRAEVDRIPHAVARHCGPQPDRERGHALLPQSAGEAIGDACVLAQVLLRLHSHLDHLERVDDHGFGDAGDEASDEVHQTGVRGEESRSSS